MRKFKIYFARALSDLIELLKNLEKSYFQQKYQNFQ